MAEKDYSGNIGYFQKQLDDEGVDYDMSNWVGCTFTELSHITKALIEGKRRREAEAKK